MSDMAKLTINQLVAFLKLRSRMTLNTTRELPNNVTVGTIRSRRNQYSIRSEAITTEAMEWFFKLVSIFVTSSSIVTLVSILWDQMFALNIRRDEKSYSAMALTVYWSDSISASHMSESIWNRYWSSPCDQIPTTFPQSWLVNLFARSSVQPGYQNVIGLFQSRGFPFTVRMGHIFCH